MVVFVVAMVNDLVFVPVTVPLYVHDPPLHENVPLANTAPPTVIDHVPVHELAQEPLVTVEVIVPLTPPNVPGPLSTPFESVKPVALRVVV